VVVAPLFVLYDYTFRPAGAGSMDEGLAMAYRSGVVCSDEFLLHPDPFGSRQEWCRQRIEHTEQKLANIDQDMSTVLVGHYPLLRDPTAVLWYPEFAQWCGTEHTAGWIDRFRAAAVVYGHLHIPRVTWHGGVPLYEVSVGYPREWRRRGRLPEPRQIFPVSEAEWWM
jgi:hypothetical protein